MNTLLISMPRKYGEEQRIAVLNIQQDLVNDLQDLYLKTFEKLNNESLGDGVLAKLTQQILLSRDGALFPLSNELKN